MLVENSIIKCSSTHIDQQDEYYNINYALGIPKLPQKTTHHLIQKHHLVIEPLTPKWLVLDHIEYVAFKLLQNSMSCNDTICYLSHTFQKPPHIIETKVDSLIQKIIDNDFLETPKPRNISKNPARTIKIIIHLTNACNLACLHCYVSSGQKFKNELTLEGWKKVFDELAVYHLPVDITFSGGEPLLYPHLIELLKYVHTKNFLNVNLVTNGTCCSSLDQVETLSQYLDQITVSLDGATADIHNNIRGQDCFDKVLKTLTYLKQIKKKFRLSITVMKQNLQDLQNNLAPLLKEIGEEFIDELLMDTVIDAGRASVNSKAVLLDHLQYNPVSSIWDRLLQAGIRRQLKSRWTRPVPIANNCNIGNVVEIHADGRVGLCDFSKNLGNITQHSFLSILNEAQAIHSKTQVDHLQPCSSCDIRYVCGGGCKATHLRLTGDPTKVICSDIFKNHYYNLLVEHEISYIRSSSLEY